MAGHARARGFFVQATPPNIGAVGRPPGQGASNCARLTGNLILRHKTGVASSTSLGTRSEENRIMKNIAIVALLATMASVGALAACGGGSEPAKSPDNAAASASAAPADSAAAPASSAK
jgi:hypothetical protein